MRIHQAEQLPDEIRSKVMNLVEELATIQEALKVTEQRNRQLRKELLETLSTIGVHTGELMDASDIGIRVRILQKSSRRLDPEILKRLGVSLKVLEEATVETQGKPYLRLEGGD